MNRSSNIARVAVCTAAGGGPVLVRVVARRADEVPGFGDARLWSETTGVDLRVAEASNPRSRDRIEIDGEASLIQGEPVRERERLSWTLDLRPASAGWRRSSTSRRTLSPPRPTR